MRWARSSNEIRRRMKKIKKRKKIRRKALGSSSSPSKLISQRQDRYKIVTYRDKAGTRHDRDKRWTRKRQDRERTGTR